MLAHAETTYSLRDFVEWDTRNWSVALEYWQANRSRPLDGCRALELGSRNGGLSLWLALQGARVVCSDVKGPTETAVARHRAGNVADRIEYRAIDATDIPYTEEFDVVVFKSVLGGIGTVGGREAQAKAVREMQRALKPGGELLFAENLVASPIHAALRRRYVRWGSRWLYVTVDEMREYLSDFADVRLRTIGSAGVFGQTETQREWLGLGDRVLFERLTPSKWRYIVAGVATK